MLFKLQLCIFRVFCAWTEKNGASVLRETISPYVLFCMGGAWRKMRGKTLMLWQQRVVRCYHILHGKLNGAYEVEIRIRGLSRAISRLPIHPLIGGDQRGVPTFGVRHTTDSRNA